MLKAIIFDCDGVIANTEPLHFRAFQKVLAEEDIQITEEDYYRHYLALDDRGCYIKAFSTHQRKLTDEKLRWLIDRKSHYFDPVIRAHLSLFPGAVDFIRRAAQRYPLAIASGALRNEIDLILEHGGISDCFAATVTAEDVTRGKPDPESFQRALHLINAMRDDRIEPGESLVIEDSIRGIEAAHLAGMRCLAITNSYGREQLSEAERVIESLEGLTLKDVEAMFAD